MVSPSFILVFSMRGKKREGEWNLYDTWSKISYRLIVHDNASNELVCPLLLDCFNFLLESLFLLELFAQK